MPLHSNVRLLTKCCLAFLIFLSSTPCIAKALGQTVTFSGKNVPLTKVFAAIEDQTSYGVFVDHKLLAEMKNVSLEVKDATIQDVLQQCLAAQSVPLEFFIQGTTITIVKKKEVKEKEEPTGPQEFRGTVIGQDGRPLMGATVLLKGLNRSGVTNENGEFILHEVPNGKHKVEISYVGYDRVVTEISVTSHQVKVSIEMKLSINNMDAPVVKGYYNTTKRLNTGNVSTVRADEIQKQPVSDPIQALEGRVPGLYVQQTSGVPGANNTVNIRGRNSLFNGLAPLYIVDGVPFNSNSLTNNVIGGGAAGNPYYASPSDRAQGLSPFNSLNPSDIESIDVLKDADATAIYGSRGANGVILITTKRGKAGQTKVDFNVNTGEGRVTRKLQLLSTQQYLQMRHEAFANDNKKPGANDNDINGTWDTTRYTDWQKVLIGNPSHFTNAQVNISGGNANTQFSISGGYTRQGVVFPGDYHDSKANGAINLSHRTNDQRFQVQFTTSFSNDNNNLPNADLTGQINLAPDAPPLFLTNGNLNWQLKNGNNTWNNPVAYLFQNDKSTTKFFISNLALTYKIIDGLQLKASFGYTYSQMDQRNTSPAVIVPPAAQSPSIRSLQIASSNRESWIIEPQLSYHKKVSNGVLDVLAGTTFQDNSFFSTAYGASGFSSDELINNPAAASTFGLSGNQQTKYRYNAVFGRIGYSWEDKYLLNITGRRDGSSRFGPGRRFGNFGAVGAGWVFTREHFMEKLSFLSFGKLRASYGTTGNDQIPDYQFLSYYTPIQTSYLGATVLNPMQLTNPYFAWERVNKLEGGIELGFLNDRINMSVSYYRNRSGDQLVNYTLPSITGFSSVTANLPAVVQNTGTEVTLNVIPVRTKNFTWSSIANLTIPNTKLVSFPDIVASGYSRTFIVGQPLSIQQKFHVIGIDTATGFYKFQTKNANGRPTAPNEYVATKPVTQQFYGGWRNTFSYKGLELDVFVQFVKQRGYDYRQVFFMPGVYSFGVGNQPTYVLDRWTRANTSATYMRYSVGQPALTWYNLLRNSSDGIVTDASFIRLKNISISYQLPGEWRQKAHIQSARIYLQCQNLFTITSYKGMDPETGGLNLPPLRMITGGLQFSL